MRFISLLLLAIVIAALPHPTTAKDYTADAMLDVLGKSKFSNEHKLFSNFWLLDKTGENGYGGIKLIYNHHTENVDTILVCGFSCIVHDKPYSKCTSPLPFQIKLTDPLDSLVAKFHSEANMSGHAFLLHSIGYDALVHYTTNGKIEWIKFFKNNISAQNITAPAAPLREVPQAPVNEKLEQARKLVEQENFTHSSPKKEAPPVITHPKEVPAAAVNRKIEDAKRNIEATAFKTEEKKEIVEVSAPNVSVFKKSLLDIFKAYSSSGFKNVQGDPKPVSNFWNYKYTYATKLKVPGEKYSMLYSFPFQNSQLDFVSILKEVDAYDSSVADVYHRFEKQLMAEFTAADGWTSVCLPNSDNNKLSDLEFKHERYGSVILDCTKSPKGRYVVFLRFLFFSN
ncbi:MAG: hypothetical protein JNK66_11140 [Chitinophagales bacterium]|nr:hypothetical protein [Chitinophagales bacterium]